MYGKLLILLLVSTSAGAFDYLEHSFFTDRSCYEAQKLLGKNLKSRDEVAAYLAMALYCPSDWKSSYCKDDYKMARGHINLLEEHPLEGGELSLTLGDVSAIPDHTDKFGPLKNIPTATREGLLGIVLEWLEEDRGEADGFIGDVAEDACETDGLTSWKHVEQSLDGFEKLELHKSYFKTGFRSPVLQGPSDPAGAYSFDNPQYLDMVHKNHHHFGKRSWQTWLGLHQAAMDLSTSECENFLPESDKSCAHYRNLVKKRLQHWSKTAEPSLVSPVRQYLDNPDDSLMARTFSSFVGLTFEGLALHFLQDNLAGGHVRTDRASLNLEDSRYYHDLDGKFGVTSEFTAREKRYTYLAWGDGHLLGNGAGADVSCPKSGEANHPRAVTNCLMQFQRGLLLSTSRDSLLHWATNGKHSGNYLAMQSVVPPGENQGKIPGGLPLGTLPLPRDDFSYQSILVSSGLNQTGDVFQTGARLNFLSSLGDEAGWLTSYNFGLFVSDGKLSHNDYKKYHTEFSYGFHWRWAARFLINAAPFFELARELNRNQKITTMGIGPRIGMTFLPEGWIRLPLDITLSWKTPYRIYNSEDGFHTSGKPNQWFEISVGLSFM